MTGYPSIDRPWLKFYTEEAVNAELPQCSIYEYLTAACKGDSDGIAIDYFGSNISYGNLIKSIDEAASAFYGCGVRENDVVTICSLTTPEMICCLYGLSKLGAVANIVEPRTNPKSIVDRINGTNSKLLVILDIFYHKIKSFDIHADGIVILSLASSMPARAKLGFVLTKGRKIPPIEYSDKLMKWSSFIARRDNSRSLAAAPYRARKPAAIIYTSGTTGIPKGAQLTDDSLNAIAFQYRFLFPYNRGDSFLDIMPPFIAYGLTCGIHMPLTLGLKLIIIPAFSPDKFDGYIAEHKPNVFIGVPSHFEYLIKSPRLKSMDLSFIKVCGMGGDSLNPELEVELDKFLKAHGALSEVYKGYGMTEMSSAAASLTHLTGGKAGSVGVPFQFNNASVFVPGTDEELKYGEEGEICFSGPGMMLGYYNNDAETQRVLLRHSDGTVWAHTQDIGYMDEEGFIYFKGRIKRMIVRPDGHNVWPLAIENVVAAHPAVKDCAVVGLPNRKGKDGRIPTAFVVIGDNYSEAAAEEELRALCLKELPERDAPLLYYFVEKIPLTSVGKVDYRQLETGTWENKDYSL